jgi:hypothetical protein
MSGNEVMTFLHQRWQPRASDVFQMPYSTTSLMDALQTDKGRWSSPIIASTRGPRSATMKPDIIATLAQFRRLITRRLLRKEDPVSGC